MGKVKVAVAGYGTVGQRLAYAVTLQEDMELAGVADIAPTLPVRAMHEDGMPYALYLGEGGNPSKFAEYGIPVAGTMDELLDEADIVLDATPRGAGARNRKLYERKGIKAIFQGGERNSVAEALFHSGANYGACVGLSYLKITSCSTTGLVRAADCLDAAFGLEKLSFTIIRCAADPGDYHRGLTNALQLEKAPPHQATDLMTLMPHIKASGLLVYTPVTHGNIITVMASGRRKIRRDEAVEALRAHPRVRVVSIEQGFKGNASLYKYARDVGRRRGDMYEVALWRDSVAESGNDVLFALHIPQESVIIPETIDAVRAAMGMQTDSAKAAAATDRYLKDGRPGR